MSKVSTTCVFKGTKGSLKTNSNGKPYMWCTVSIAGKDFPAMIYGKSLDITIEGETINADIQQLPGSDTVQITAWNPSLMSDTPLPTVKDFAKLFAKIGVEA